MLSVLLSNTTTTSTASSLPLTQNVLDFTGIVALVAAVLTALFLGPTFFREIRRIMIRPNLRLDKQIVVDREPRFLKYPGHLQAQTRTNLAYCKLTIQNVKPSGRLKKLRGKGRGTAHVSMTLRVTNAEGKAEEFRLLWLVSSNPSLLPIAPGEGVPVHFLTIDMEGHEMLVPTVSAGEPGKWSGSLLVPGTYELELKWSGGEWVSLGRYDLPREMLSRAHVIEVARYAEEHGGYCIYFDKVETGVRIEVKGDYPEAGIIDLYDRNNPTQMLVNGMEWHRPPKNGYRPFEPSGT